MLVVASGLCLYIIYLRCLNAAKGIVWIARVGIGARQSVPFDFILSIIVLVSFIEKKTRRAGPSASIPTAKTGSSWGPPRLLSEPKYRSWPISSRIGRKKRFRLLPSPCLPPLRPSLSLQQLRQLSSAAARNRRAAAKPTRKRLIKT